MDQVKKSVGKFAEKSPKWIRCLLKAALVHVLGMPAWMRGVFMRCYPRLGCPIVDEIAAIVSAPELANTPASSSKQAARATPKGLAPPVLCTVLQKMQINRLFCSIKCIVVCPPKCLFCGKTEVLPGGRTAL